MCLLAKRYDLESGRCAVDSFDGIAPPAVRVEFVNEATAEKRIETTSRESSLIKLSNAILDQPCSSADSETRPAVLLPGRTPRIGNIVPDDEPEQRIDTRCLDLDPALRDGPRRSKLARLAREVLTDPIGVEPPTLDAALRRAFPNRR